MNFIYLYIVERDKPISATSCLNLIKKSLVGPNFLSHKPLPQLETGRFQLSV